MLSPHQKKNQILINKSLYKQNVEKMQNPIKPQKKKTEVKQ